MSYAVAMVTLAGAALLEAGGDALMRAGIHHGTTWGRITLMAAASVLLAGYGYTVNSPPWNFGRLLGVYVAMFFVVAQAIAWLGFRVKPDAHVMLGGMLIIAGGLVVSWG